MIRIGLFGHPLGRPLEFVDAFLGADLASRRSDSVEMGACRLFVVETLYRDQSVEISACIPPRREPERAFVEVLEECDAGIVLAGAGGWAEQQPVLEALARARAAQPRPVGFVGVVNEFVPPRLEGEPSADEVAAALDAPRVVRGRICWWRHERSGTESAREAVSAAMDLGRGRD